MKQDFFHKGNSALLSVDLILIALALTSAKSNFPETQGEYFSQVHYGRWLPKALSFSPQWFRCIKLKNTPHNLHVHNILIHIAHVHALGGHDRVVPVIFYHSLRKVCNQHPTCHILSHLPVKYISCLYFFCSTDKHVSFVSTAHFLRKRAEGYALNRTLIAHQKHLL